MEHEKDLKRHLAYWTCEDDEHVGYLYYFAPGNAAKPPYKTREVRAILNIAADGTLAGVELIDNMPPPPEEA